MLIVKIQKGSGIMPQWRVMTWNVMSTNKGGMN
jgi:hypothetical protein